MKKCIGCFDGDNKTCVECKEKLMCVRTHIPAKLSRSEMMDLVGEQLMAHLDLFFLTNPKKTTLQVDDNRQIRIWRMETDVEYTLHGEWS